jgi:dTDP-4-dehydrorhamnose 3,5-epimerase
MLFEKLKIKGSWLATAPVMEDSRGSFSELFKYDEILAETGQEFRVAQANTSISRKGALRGLHFSLALGGQSKWVGCMSGSLIDVMVDLREGSPSFLEHVSYKLDMEQQNLLFVPSGVAHGFLALEDETRVVYLLTGKYQPSHEYGVDALDATLKIDWPEMEFIRSTKDAQAPSFDHYLKENLLPKYC